MSVFSPVGKVRIPNYRLHKGSGQAFVQVGGKRFYLGVYGTAESQERYARFIAERAVKRATTPATTPAGAKNHDMLVVELVDAYWDFAQRYYRKNGQPSGSIPRIRVALRHLRILYGRTPAADFGPLALQAIQEMLAVERKSRRYVNDIGKTIRRVFKWAAGQEMIPAAVYHGLLAVDGLKAGRTTARETAPITPVAEDVVDATLPHLTPVVADMVRFQRLTGCQPGEVCSLRPCDMDRSREVWQYRPASHKTEHHGKERVIFIGPKAQAVLLPYLLRAADAYCFSPADSEAKRHVELRARRQTRVQPSQRNRRKARPKRQPADHYTKDSYGRAIHRAIDKANEAGQAFPHWHANQLRHSMATEIRRNFGLEAAQVVLGHSKADVTQVYAERDHALAADVMRRIG